jgi:hypothetical protein
VPPDPAFRTSTRVGRDHWVRVLSSDYSVQPRVIGRRVEIRADLDEVVITCGGDVVGRHRRALAPHRTVTDPAHETSARYLREERRKVLARGRDIEVEVRDLATHDRLSGWAL